MRISTAAAILFLFTATASAQVPRTECFPIERVPGPLRVRAEAMLLETMDGIALYTIAGGLKPMTSGFLTSLGRGRQLMIASGAVTGDSAIARQIDELRQIFVALRCGDEIQSAVMTDILNVPTATQSALETFVFHMPSVRAVIASFPEYFSSLAITPHTSPETMLFTMNRWRVAGSGLGREARVERIRTDPTDYFNHTKATGLLYGYPRPAVEAFATQSVRAIRGEQPSTQETRAQLDMRIPNFTGDEVWYVKAAPEDGPEDAALRARAARILAEYKKRREQYIGAGKPGIVALLRDWYCKTNACSAANATVQ